MRIHFSHLGQADRYLKACNRFLNKTFGIPAGTSQRIRNAFCQGFGYNSYQDLRTVLSSPSRNYQPPGYGDLRKALAKGFGLALGIVFEATGRTSNPNGLVLLGDDLAMRLVVELWSVPSRTTLVAPPTEGDDVVNDILTTLDDYRGPFPSKLVDALDSERTQVIPELLDILADLERNPDDYLFSDRLLDIWAIYLLALFREERAYPILLRVFSHNKALADDDFVLQDLGRILASVSGGDATGLMGVIEDETVEYQVRESCMSGLLALVDSGARSRSEIMEYLRTLFAKFERTEGPMWDWLVFCCCCLGPAEAMEEILQAYADQLADDGVMSLDEVREWLELGEAGARALGREATRPNGVEPLITDLAKDMGWMKYFSPPYDPEHRLYT